MAFTFQSLRSSSSGNCLLLRTGRTSILFDCGLRSQWECRALFQAHAGGRVDAAFISHAHSDHVGYPALRAFAQAGTPVHCHETVAPYLRRKHGLDEWATPPPLRLYAAGAAVEVGDVLVEPFEVPHDPDTPTHGFTVRHAGLSAVVCTDFHNYAGVLDRFVDADLIFLESNHDPHLLRLYPNYASRWHLSNPKAAWLLYHATSRSRRPAQTVVLGHLSDQRNRAELALDSVRSAFARQQEPVPFHLLTAPLYEPSEVITVTADRPAAFPRTLFDAEALV